jgi:protein farnesyltransferase subunit beta
MRSDFYHSLYSLAGLSATQRHYIYDAGARCDEEGGDQVFKWTVDGKIIEGEEGDRVETCHPIFVLPWGNAERIREWFVRYDRERAESKK